MDIEFYRAFEDEFRGARDLIKVRLKQYIPFINPLKEIYPHIIAIDLGCGRGEWLELMRENHISAVGVDIDDKMLSACRERGLKVETADAIEYLKGLSDESVSIISAFHLVEHISFENLDRLVRESLRILKPAGLLILETPNPENIVVGASEFYLDPTHKKPIPSKLLEFVSRYCGFNRVKVARFNEQDNISFPELKLIDVIGGVSPDYAVISQKVAVESLLELFNEPFDKEYGVSLIGIAERYDAHMVDKISVLEDKCREAISRYTSKVNELEGMLNEMKLAMEGKRNSLFSSYLSRCGYFLLGRLKVCMRLLKLR
ncbi:hypothetical protein Maes01_00003 [Microbulbifer aestuariivivens]|uniref:Methyltransferase type 11 domain-containing protein n=1 Tax=Microbulbifer aestuariivivens TaxID=1908308 RepID=A0ABP9WJR1_9GAMM